MTHPWTLKRAPGGYIELHVWEGPPKPKARGVVYCFAASVTRPVAHEFLRLAREELDRRIRRASTPIGRTYNPTETK